MVCDADDVTDLPAIKISQSTIKFIFTFTLLKTRLSFIRWKYASLEAFKLIGCESSPMVDQWINDNICYEKGQSSINQSINRSLDRSIDRSTNQPSNQPTNQSIFHESPLPNTLMPYKENTEKHIDLLNIYIYLFIYYWNPIQMYN